MVCIMWERDRTQPEIVFVGQTWSSPHSFPFELVCCGINILVIQMWQTKGRIGHKFW